MAVEVLLFGVVIVEDEDELGLLGLVLTVAPAFELGTPFITEADPVAEAEADCPPEAVALAPPEAEAETALVGVTSIVVVSRPSMRRTVEHCLILLFLLACLFILKLICVRVIYPIFLKLNLKKL